MFKLELTWDRPAKISSTQSKHTLRIRIIPQTEGKDLPTLPCHLALALDTSMSMAGEKLQQAKLACKTVVTQLRKSDRFSLASFSTQVTTLIQGSSNEAEAKKAISELKPGGVTRTDLALNWLKTALPAEAGVARVGILITDGQATNAGGMILDDVNPLTNQAAELSDLGMTLCVVGLGDAANFNTALLTDLSDKGKGAFLYADTPASLAPMLETTLRKSQAIALLDAKLTLKPSPGVTIKGFCRYRPEYLPLEETAKNQLYLGTIAANKPTDILIALETPAATELGNTLGKREIIEVQLTGEGVSATEKAEINYTNSYREAQQLNQEVDGDRLGWEINLYSKEIIDIGDSNPKRTGVLLEEIQIAAIKAGQNQIAEEAAKQNQELKQTGKLNPDRATGMLRESRKLGE